MYTCTTHCYMVVVQGHVAGMHFKTVLFTLPKDNKAGSFLKHKFPDLTQDSRNQNFPGNLAFVMSTEDMSEGSFRTQYSDSKRENREREARGGKNRLEVAAALSWQGLSQGQSSRALRTWLLDISVAIGNVREGIGFEERKWDRFLTCSIWDMIHNAEEHLGAFWNTGSGQSRISESFSVSLTMKMRVPSNMGPIWQVGAWGAASHPPCASSFSFVRGPSSNLFPQHILSKNNPQPHHPRHVNLSMEPQPIFIISCITSPGMAPTLSTE